MSFCCFLVGNISFLSNDKCLHLCVCHHGSPSAVTVPFSKPSFPCHRNNFPLEAVMRRHIQSRLSGQLWKTAFDVSNSSGARGRPKQTELWVEPLSGAEPRNPGCTLPLCNKNSSLSQFCCFHGTRGPEIPLNFPWTGLNLESASAQLCCK